MLMLWCIIFEGWWDDLHSLVRSTFYTCRAALNEPCMILKLLSSKVWSSVSSAAPILTHKFHLPLMLLIGTSDGTIQSIYKFWPKLWQDYESNKVKTSLQSSLLWDLLKIYCTWKSIRNKVNFSTIMNWNVSCVSIGHITIGCTETM